MSWDAERKKRALESMLYGVGSRDAATLLGAALLAGVVAFLAVLLPARRAARVDPQRSLRAE